MSFGFHLWVEIPNFWWLELRRKFGERFSSLLYYGDTKRYGNIEPDHDFLASLVLHKHKDKCGHPKGLETP